MCLCPTISVFNNPLLVFGRHWWLWYWQCCINIYILCYCAMKYIMMSAIIWIITCSSVIRFVTLLRIYIFIFILKITFHISANITCKYICFRQFYASRSVTVFFRVRESMVTTVKMWHGRILGYFMSMETHSLYRNFR